MIGRDLARTAAFAAPILAASLLARAQVPAPLSGPGIGSALRGADEPLRYARVAVERARVRNVADDKGIVVAEVERGSLVAVHAEQESGWLSVEVPGGYAVWVFGRYLEATDEPDVLEVTTNAVNIRPSPSSDVTSFPLPQRLQAGDRVRLIELFEPEKPLAETWARVWSPPGVRAWLRASATEPLGAGEDGAALWREALRFEPQAPPTRAESVARQALVAADADARAKLDSARARLAAEQAKENPDFGAVRGAYAALLREAPDGPIAAQARADLERITALEEAATLRAELERERERRAEAARAEHARVLESSRRKDPLGQVFLARGVLLRRVGTDGIPHYLLRFGNDVSHELVCQSGRYELALFAGYEVGVQGQELAAAQPDGPRVLEISRLEVIARR